LPDFIFGRDNAAEEANSFTLAGKLVTDIKPPKDGSHKRRPQFKGPYFWIQIAGAPPPENAPNIRVS
jgi:hypothetical protein